MLNLSVLDFQECVLLWNSWKHLLACESISHEHSTVMSFTTFHRISTLVQYVIIVPVSPALFTDFGQLYSQEWWVMLNYAGDVVVKKNNR